MVSCHRNITTYYGYGLYVKYCLNCHEQIHKSRPASLVYQVLPQQKSCLVVLWSRLAVFSHNRHASVVRIGKAVVRLEFPSLQLWLILCPSNYWRDLGHVNICDILLLLGNLQASEKKFLITLTPMSHKIRLVLPGFIIPTLKFWRVVSQWFVSF